MKGRIVYFLWTCVTKDDVQVERCARHLRAVSCCENFRLRHSDERMIQRSVQMRTAHTDRFWGLDFRGLLLKGRHRKWATAAMLKRLTVGIVSQYCAHVHLLWPLPREMRDWWPQLSEIGLQQREELKPWAQMLYGILHEQNT